MARPCASCSSEHREEIDRKLRSGVANVDVSRWLGEIGDPITPHAIGRHAKDHLGVLPTVGRRPLSGSFLQGVVQRAYEGIEDGSLNVSVRDGIAAQAEINRQSEKMQDRDLFLKIAVALTGGAAVMIEPPDPAIEAIEAEFRPLLTAGE